MAWNRIDESKAAKKSAAGNGRYSKFKGLLAGVIVVAVGFAVICLLHSPTSEKDDKTVVKQSLIKEFSPSIATNSTVKEETAAEQKPKKEEPKPYVKKPGQMQLPDGKVLTFPPPKEGEIRKIYAYGHLYECDHLGNFKDVSKRHLFKTAFEENFLAFAQAGKGYIPAFLTGLDEDAVKKMLEKNYTPIGDETDEEMAALKAYDEMRCAALAYMEQGGRFDDFVNEYITFDRKERQAKSVSLQEIITTYLKGDVAGAKEIAKAANIMMEKNGYMPITLPKDIQAALDAVPDEE